MTATRTIAGPCLLGVEGWAAGAYCWYASVAVDGSDVDGEKNAVAIQRGPLLPL